MDTEETFEYELIDINFGYELPEEEGVFAHEEEPIDKSTLTIEYDADGIPMGTSQEEVDMRRAKVHEYIQQWRADHKDDPRIFNEDLNDFIRINHLFLLESVNHAVNNYYSTKAVLHMEEIMSKAKYIGDSKKKEGDNNQKSFEKMVIMIYKSGDLGNVKMTVGIKNRTKEKIEYSITVPPPHTPFIAENLKFDTDKKKRKKHHK